MIVCDRVPRSQIPRQPAPNQNLEVNPSCAHAAHFPSTNSHNPHNRSHFPAARIELLLHKPLRAPCPVGQAASENPQMPSPSPPLAAVAVPKQQTEGDAGGGGGEEEPIPDDFFEDFDNNAFLQGLVEQEEAAAQTAEANQQQNQKKPNDRTDDNNDSNAQHNDTADDGDDEVAAATTTAADASTGETGRNDTRSRHTNERSSSPIVADCLKEIDKLTQDIRRRKRLLRLEIESSSANATTDGGGDSRRSSYRRRASRSRTPVDSTRRHGSSTYHPHRSGAPSSSSRHSARSRSRSRSPLVDRRGAPSSSSSLSLYQRQRARQARHARHTSNSPSRSGDGRSASRSTTAGISFLDELERTFARQGKEFPEKELLLQQKRNGTLDHRSHPAKRQRHVSPPPMPLPVRTPLLENPLMMQQMNAINAQQQQLNMQQQHMMMNSSMPAFQPYGQQQQQPLPTTSSLMAAANALIPPMYGDYGPMGGDYGVVGVGGVGSGGGGGGLLPLPVEPQPIIVIPDLSPVSAVPPASVQIKFRSLQQSKAAIKLLGQAEHRVPQVQFIYTRTTFDQRNAGHINGQKANSNSAPIRSSKNAMFQFTDGTHREPTVALGARLGRLSARLRNTTIVLGFNSDALAAATRMKSQASQVMRSISATTTSLPYQASSQFGRTPAVAVSAAAAAATTAQPTTSAGEPWSSHVHQQQRTGLMQQPLPIVAPSPVPPPPIMPQMVPAPVVAVQLRSVHVQTGALPPCAECTARAAIQHQTRDTQTVDTKTASVRTQTVATGDAATETNGGGGGAITVPSTIASTVAQPLQKSLSSMTAGQLVAMTDFARIICDPWPANSVEMFKLREQLMDVYNLSQRDDEQVAAAERNKLNSVRNLLAGKKATTAAAAVVPSTVLPSMGMAAQPLQQQPQQQQQQPGIEWGRSAAFNWDNAGRNEPQRPDGAGDGGHFNDHSVQQQQQQPHDWRWSNDPKEQHHFAQQQQQQQHHQHPEMQPWSGGMAPNNQWPHPGDMRGPFGGGAARGSFGRGGRGGGRGRGGQF